MMFDDEMMYSDLPSTFPEWGEWRTHQLERKVFTPEQIERILFYGLELGRYSEADYQRLTGETL